MFAACCRHPAAAERADCCSAKHPGRSGTHCRTAGAAGSSSQHSSSNIWSSGRHRCVCVFVQLLEAGCIQHSCTDVFCTDVRGRLLLLLHVKVCQADGCAHGFDARCCRHCRHLPAHAAGAGCPRAAADPHPGIPFRAPGCWSDAGRAAPCCCGTAAGRQHCRGEGPEVLGVPCGVCSRCRTRALTTCAACVLS